VSPYKSKAQAGKFHEMLKRGEISKATVDEFDKASKGMRLPARVKPKPPKPRARPGK
jgi:hypothetical protein